MQLINWDCLEEMKKMKDNSMDLILTDIPYWEVNRKSNWLRKLDKWNADILTFDINTFIEECYRISKSTVIIFCWNEQYSWIYDYFNQKQKKSKWTVRQLIWAKSNPSPMNWQHIYLSWTENAVWFKKRWWTFNAHCKKNVFIHPTWRSKLHPTEKNHKLLEELITDNSNKWDIVFDPCMWSGSHWLVSKNLNRDFIGIELDKEYFKIAEERIKVKNLLQNNNK